MRYSIRYDDGMIWYSWIDGSWDEAPSEGVQIILMYYTYPFREIIQGHDVFTMLGETSLKYGRWMSDEAYAKLVQEALEEPHPFKED